MDLLHLAPAIRELHDVRSSAFLDPLSRELRQKRAMSRSEGHKALERFVESVDIGIADQFIFTLSDVAELTDLAKDRVRRITEALSTHWGENSSFRLPTDVNRFRRYGIVPIGDDLYFCPAPVLLLHEAMGWFIDVLRTRGLPRLEQKVLDSRDEICEQLPREALASVFGQGRVLGPLRYDAEGSPDVDAVVRVPSDILTIESKAHTMTDAGRRGAPKRVEKKLQELVEVPMRQARRFVDHVVSGGSATDQRGARHQFPLAQDAQTPIMGVTFERVDPLMTVAATSSGLDSSASGWLVPLCDLLVLTEVLDDPASLWAYCCFRVQVVLAGRVLAAAEPQLLGCFLGDLGRAITGVNEEASKFGQVVLFGFEEPINAYYAGRHPRRVQRKPEVPVPKAIRAALKRTLDEGNPSWTSLVIAVYSQPKTVWTTWRNIARRRRNAELVCESSALRVRLTLDGAPIRASGLCLDVFEVDLG